MPEAKLSLRGVTKSFGNQAVLKGIDLEVADGEMICAASTSWNQSMMVLFGWTAWTSLNLALILGQSGGALASYSNRSTCSHT
jgi:hypothetical protein